MMHSIDDLLELVNRVAKAPTIEDLRKSVTHNVTQVYRKVGSPTLWQGAVHHYEDTALSLKLPDYCIVPLSLVSGRIRAEAFGETGLFNGYETAGRSFFRSADAQRIPFNRQGETIWLQGGSAPYLTDSLTLSYWRIPLAEDESPLIDDRIYEACILYCQASEARIGLHGRNTQSFSGVPYQVDKQEANAAIDAARADCNQMTPNTWLSFFSNFKTSNR